MSTIYCSIRLRMILQTEILISMTLLCVPCPVVKEEYLFPIINGENAEKATMSRAVSKWFARYMNSIGLADRTLTFHSFRHSFKALGRSYNVEKSILDCLQGHKDSSVSMNYGLDEYGSPYSLDTLYKAILKIDVFNVL